MTKLAQFKKYQANPELESFRMLQSMKEDMKKNFMEQEERITKNIVSNPELVTAILVSVGKAIKGEDGYTPKAGVDYYTEKDIRQVIAHIESRIRIPKDGIDDIDGVGEKGDDGYTPKAGIDYPTKEQCKEMVTQEVYKLFSVKPKDDKMITKEEVQILIGKVQEKADFKERAGEIARALETLRGNERLDYEALKNRPGVKMYDDKPKIMLRSGPAMTILAATGTKDETNTSFTFIRKPTFICVNGNNYRQNFGWAWNGTTLTATLEGPVGTNGDIYGVI